MAYILPSIVTILAQGVQGPGQKPAELLNQLHFFDFFVNPLLAAVLGIVLALTYRHTHKGLSYSQSFTQTILLLSVIVAVVMMTIGSDLAKSFALVGALSIVRFRTVVKDTRDIAFIFGALAVGMAAGTANDTNNHLTLATIGCGFIVAVTMLMYAANFGALYKSEFILRFTFDQQKDSANYLSRLAEMAKRSNMLHIEPSGDGSSLRLTYDIQLEKDASAEKLTSSLSKIEGVSDVVLIVSKNDVDY
ncbi:DUF4956 domain-containing protein [Planctomycetota bacterium]|nr:DUF4956 domain-containing protein [Planctomycetota bacterium]GDY03208.1 DUF4956 domain-containing protein [Planctomycetota bacterium]